MSDGNSSVRRRQEPLRELYEDAPGEALITDQAKTTSSVEFDPFHGATAPGSQDYGIVWEFGIHRAVGGDHDAPNPGDLLAAALATCLDSTIRMIADRMGLSLKSLEVEVTAVVDVRGTLVVSRDVPVGFQSMGCHVDIEPEQGTDAALLSNVLKTAEYSCVNLQTLRAGVPVETTVNTVPNDE